MQNLGMSFSLLKATSICCWLLLQLPRMPQWLMLVMAS